MQDLTKLAEMAETQGLIIETSNSILKLKLHEENYSEHKFWGIDRSNSMDRLEDFIRTDRRIEVYQYD